MTFSQNTEIQAVLTTATTILNNLQGHTLDVLAIGKPPDAQYAANLARVLSKLSPLVGNMLEFAVVSSLNQYPNWPRNGHWVRQDPGFPDTLFLSDIHPAPGIEIKAWFPLATEITGRFRESVTHFAANQTHVAVIAWLPEYIIYGQPSVRPQR